MKEKLNFFFLFFLYLVQMCLSSLQKKKKKKKKEKERKKEKNYWIENETTGKNDSRINFTALAVINYREDVSTPRVLNICVFRAPPGTLTL